MRFMPFWAFLPMVLTFFLILASRTPDWSRGVLELLRTRPSLSSLFLLRGRGVLTSEAALLKWLLPPGSSTPSSDISERSLLTLRSLFFIFGLDTLGLVVLSIFELMDRMAFFVRICLAKLLISFISSSSSLSGMS
uniref:Secreted protein n=1 Tax=Ixodes ricinus TaxID=34613 RepID=A0A6B0USB1_IXORI